MYVWKTSIHIYIAIVEHFNCRICHTGIVQPVITKTKHLLNYIKLDGKQKLDAEKTGVLTISLNLNLHAVKIPLYPWFVECIQMDNLHIFNSNLVKGLGMIFSP